jgi:hypothetical protein
MKTISRLIAASLFATATTAALANPVCPGFNDQEDPGHHLFISPFTHHWTRDSEHNHVIAASLTRDLSNDRRYGAALFRNSFGQPSAYVFTGWDLPSFSKVHDRLYGFVTAGILYGYVGEYKRKVPLNVGGFSPAIVPTLGLRFTQQTSAEVHVLGTAAVMFGVNTRF